MTDMDAAHQQDMRDERLLREAVYALEALKKARRLGPVQQAAAAELRDKLVYVADHIVAVWD